MPSLARALWLAAAACVALFAGEASAGDTDRVEITVDDDDVEIEVESSDAAEDEDGDEAEEVIEIVEVHDEQHHHSHHGHHWAGAQFSTVLTPYRIKGPTEPSKRVTSNQARACLNPAEASYCGNVRGFDLKLNVFKADDRRDYPRWVGYFRTGYTAGIVDFAPTEPEAGYRSGDSQTLRYFTVPLFFGGNIYFLRNFPLRPYGGLGFGFDVLQVAYDRADAPRMIDTSARIGFELHAGLEARITNYVAVNAEVMQLWSARRKLDNVPDFSNEGLTFLVGASFALPTYRSRRHHHGKVKTIKKVRRVKQAPPPAPVALPPPSVPEEATPLPEEPPPLEADTPAAAPVPAPAAAAAPAPAATPAAPALGTTPPPAAPPAPAAPAPAAAAAPG